MKELSESLIDAAEGSYEVYETQRHHRSENRDGIPEEVSLRTLDIDFDHAESGSVVETVRRASSTALEPSITIGWQPFLNSEGVTVYVNQATGAKQKTCPSDFVSPQPSFLNAHCVVTFICALLLFILIAVISYLLSLVVVSQISNLLLSILPGISVIIYVAEVKWRAHVLRMAVFVCFVEAVILMFPCVLIELAIGFCITGKELGDLPTRGTSPKAWLQYFLASFVGAALIEELLKYTVVRIIAFRNYCCDPRSIIVYACSAAAAFATVENILYVGTGGFGTGVMRAFLAIPLHCSTGVLIGTSIARRKFMEKYDSDHVAYALLLPILIHGSYDFIAFASTGAAQGTSWQYGTLPALLLVVAVSMTIGRARVIQLEQVPHVDVHALVRAHHIWHPVLETNEMGLPVEVWRNAETGETRPQRPPMIMEVPCQCCLRFCCKCCME